MPIQFPPRDESLAFLATLDVYYQDDMGRQPVEDYHVDMEGTAVWLQEYLRHRVNGASHDAATARVIVSIRAVTNPLPSPTGRTRGDFLFPYFGPSYMSYPTMAARVGQFEAQKATGATDILIMPWIFRPRFFTNGWAGPRGFDFSDGPLAMGEFKATLRAIKDRGMRATVVAHDRGVSNDYDEALLVRLVKQLSEEAGDLIHAIMPVFELDEIASLGEQIQLFRELADVTQHEVRLIAHHASVQIGKEFWRAMKDSGCTDFFAQYARDASLHRLTENTKRWIDMLPSDIAFCCTEHSAPAGHSTHSPAERDERWRACADAMRQLWRPLHSFNSTTEV